MISFQHISKTFPGVKALSDVSFTINAGEVHAICGENGAGKSTLMNILVGHIQPDPGGNITIQDRVYIVKDFNYARELGIAIVYQERSLVDTLSIAENMYINRAPINRWGWIDYGHLNALTLPILKRLGLDHLHPGTLVDTLSPAEKLMVEIGKALSQNPKVLILDEPTASLSDKESGILFNIIDELKKKQVAIIYISHRLAEIFEIADRVTVLKDGKYQGTLPVKETNPGQLIKAMVGREITSLNKPVTKIGSVLLEVKQLSGHRFNDCSFSVHRGEIVALAGLIGAGRSEMARVLFGIDPKLKGEIKFDGETIHLNHPADAIALGIGYVPEDRKTQGLFLNMNVQANIVSGIYAGSQWVEETKQNEIAIYYKEKLNIQTPDLDQTIQLLSGGNQQKCVLARWLHLNPKLLIVDEPTHGIDIGAKFEIYQLLLELAAKGTAVLLISSELPEVLALADRIIVLSQGKITGILDSTASEEQILSLAATD